MKDWSARIPDAAEREEAAKLLVLWKTLSEHPPERTLDVEAAMEAAQAVRDRKFKLADDEYWATVRALDGGYSQQVEDARCAYEDNPLTCVEDFYGNPIRCALTGIPILCTDRTVSVDDTDHMILAAVLDIPAHLFEDVEDEDEPEEDVAA